MTMLTINRKDLTSGDDLLSETGVEFVGIINDKGHLEDFVGKEPQMSSGKEKEMFCMELALQNRMMKDFDNDLGNVRYNLTEREGSKYISIPTKSKVILGVMKKDIDHTKFFNKMISTLENSSFSSVS